jgi:hypothetical protein
MGGHGAGGARGLVHAGCEGWGFREAAWLNAPSHGMIRVTVSRETVPDEAMDEVSVRTAEMVR